MEKLQAALKKARDKREDGTTSTPPLHAPAPGNARPRPAGASKGWTDLEEIPLSSHALTEHRIVTQNASADATHFDVLRTKILLQMQQKGWKRLAITSPMPQCGKSTTACNLALGLGRQSGLKTMLFDMDLNAPSVGSFFGHTPHGPIADMLLGRVSFQDHAVRVGENVAISASQQPETDPTRVLLSANTRQTLDDIQEAYDPDIMIFDMPSILVGDNTRAFLKNVDCALIIARANTTKYGHYDICEREIAEHTNVLGTVLNAFRTKNAQSYMDG
jgi:Mrp family chromosome partitioning ATPase